MKSLSTDSSFSVRLVGRRRWDARLDDDATGTSSTPTTRPTSWPRAGSSRRWTSTSPRNPTRRGEPGSVSVVLDDRDGAPQVDLRRDGHPQAAGQRLPVVHGPRRRGRGQVPDLLRPDLDPAGLGRREAYAFLRHRYQARGLRSRLVGGDGQLPTGRRRVDWQGVADGLRDRATFSLPQAPEHPHGLHNRSFRGQRQASRGSRSPSSRCCLQEAILPRSSPPSGRPTMRVGALGQEEHHGRPHGEEVREDAGRHPGPDSAAPSHRGVAGPVAPGLESA